jgi:hypothetical protein
MILVVGTVGDHVSTMIALSHPYIYEANPLTLILMEKGLWLPLDMFLIVLGITIPYLLIRLKGKKHLRTLLTYPLTHGLVRLGVCFWNFSLII